MIPTFSIPRPCISSFSFLLSPSPFPLPPSPFSSFLFSILHVCDRKGLTHLAGAGAAGASAAYFLHERTEYSIPTEVVIFERFPHIGGRAKTVPGDGDRFNAVEVGANDFSDDDSSLNSLMRDVGLKPQYTEAALSGALGVWNGSAFRYSQKGGESAWWSFVKLAWEYGSAPLYTQRLIDRTMEGLRSDLERGFHTYKSVAEFVRNSLNVTTMTLTEPYIQQHGISRPFTTDIIQAATQAIYVQDLDAVHGFAAISAMANGRRRRISISRENWRLFDRMIKLSESRRWLNTKVTTITRHDNGTFSLSWVAASSAATDGNSQSQTELFDIVIIAAPFHQADITISPPLHRTPPLTSYHAQHITVFTTPHPLSASGLSLPPNTAVPDTIWTTPGFGTQPLPFPRLTKRETENREGCVVYGEYTYTLVSSKRISDAAITQLLDLSVDTFPYRPTPPIEIGNPNPEYGPIRWIHREVWPHAYPLLKPQKNSDVDDIPVELAPNLYYTSGAESVLGSSLELSAYMGRNVAELLWSNRWAPEMEP